MKIAIIGVTLSIIQGGIRRRVELAKRLEKRGYDVTLYLGNLNINPGWRGLELPSKIQKYPKEPIRAEYIFYGGDRWGRESFNKARGKKIFIFQVYIPGTECYFQDPSIVKLAFSTATAEALETKFNCRPVRAIGGINLEFFTPSNVQRDKTILMQGGDRETKGLELVEKAFHLIKGKHNNFGLKAIENCPDQYEVRERYRRAFIFASGEQDPKFCWNNPSVEAMACKCPVIVIDHRATRDHCLHKKTALVVNPNGNSIPNSMAAMMEKLITNKELRNRLAESAYKHIQKFSYEGLVDTIEKEVLEK